MITNIPIKPNHTIKGYIPSEDGTSYIPVYERIHEIGSLIVHTCFPFSEDIRLVISDTEMVDRCGNKYALRTGYPLDPNSNSDFFKDLETHDFKWENNELVKTTSIKYRPRYSAKRGFSPIEIASGSPKYSMFESWDELFDSFNECANWCNTVNKFLHRGYEEIQEI